MPVVPGHHQRGKKPMHIRVTLAIQGILMCIYKHIEYATCTCANVHPSNSCWLDCWIVVAADVAAAAAVGGISFVADCIRIRLRMRMVAAAS